jgi:hypothetical protein
MKQYVIDQLREGDFLKLEEYFDGNSEAGDLPGIYWVLVPESLFGETVSLIISPSIWTTSP